MRRDIGPNRIFFFSYKKDIGSERVVEGLQILETSLVSNRHDALKDDYA